MATQPILIAPKYSYNERGNMQLDATKRLRVSQLTTLGDYKFLYDKGWLFFDEKTNGGGSATWNSANNNIDMTVPASVGAYVIRQSKMWHPYFAGKTQLIENTCANFSLQANVVKRMGYFSSSVVAPYTANFDGLFIENDGTTYYACVYRNGTEIVKKQRSQWLDPLDGTGPSGINFDFSKFCPSVMDFLWLGGTSARFGVICQDQVVPFYIYDNSGIADNVMMLTPQQPIRYEIRSNGGSGTFSQICSSVSTEGALSLVGEDRSFSCYPFINANVVGTKYGVVGLSILPTSRSSCVYIQDASLIETTADYFKWELILNPTVAGSPTVAALANSPVNTLLGDVVASPSATTITGGTIIHTGFGGGIGIGVGGSGISESLRIGSTIDGVMDTLWLSCTPLSVNMDIFGAINFDVYG